MNILPWHAERYAQLAQRVANLPHALLFRGPAGIGKLLFAQTLAKRLLCENPGAGSTGCGACPSCHWFDNGTHPDFRLLEPETAEEGDEGETKEKKKNRWI